MYLWFFNEEIGSYLYIRLGLRVRMGEYLREGKDEEKKSFEFEDGRDIGLCFFMYLFDEGLG